MLNFDFWLHIWFYTRRLWPSQGDACGLFVELCSEAAIDV